ncbi:MAG: anthranilate synthase component I family protein, partial [Hyphomonas sp.]
MLADRLPSLDPVTAATALCGEDGFLWLDSAAAGHPASRWSYLCLWPVSRFKAEAGPDAIAVLNAWLASFKANTMPGGAPFQGGAAGYLAYDFAAAFEPRFASHHPSSGPAPIELALYDLVIAFDHAGGAATAYSAGLRTPGAAPDAGLAREKLDRLKARLAAPAASLPAALPLNWTAQTNPSAYCGAVHTAQEFIRAGDIYQANIAGLWTTRGLTREEAFAHYLMLRQRTEAPFAAFGVFDGRILASVSPERLVCADAEGRVLAEPIKGTIRRSDDVAEDKTQRTALLASEKDRAENIMIVDLLRNDLSRVCTSSSVNVLSLCRLETFTNLHHLVSTIDGQLAPGRSSADLLAAVFPGGSVTGAPNLRAMEVIDALEPAARGAFCGSLAWIGFDGAMDASILIRTLDISSAETRLWAG